MNLFYSIISLNIRFGEGGSGYAVHMGDFTQPQQKYAGTVENCNIAIALIFYPGIKRL